MAIRLGVKFTPAILEMLVRVGARITGSDGFAARLSENGIPASHRLVNSGVDRETGEVFMVFAEPGAKTSDPVQWQAPVYERDKEAGDGATA